MFRIFDWMSNGKLTVAQEAVSNTLSNAKDKAYQVATVASEKASETKKKLTGYWQGKPSVSVDDIRKRQEERKRQTQFAEEEKKRKAEEGKLNQLKAKIRVLIEQLDNEVDDLESYCFFRRSGKIDNKNYKKDKLGELLKIKELKLFLQKGEELSQDDRVITGTFSRTRDLLENIVKTTRIVLGEESDKSEMTKNNSV